MEIELIAVEGIRCRGKQMREVRFTSGFVCVYGYVRNIGTGWYGYVRAETAISVGKLLSEIEVCVGGVYKNLKDWVGNKYGGKYKIVYVEDIEVLLGKGNCLRYYQRELDKYEEYRVGCSIDRVMVDVIDVMEVIGGVSGYRQALCYYNFPLAKVVDVRSLGEGVYELTLDEVSAVDYFIVDESVVGEEKEVTVGHIRLEVVDCCGLKVLGVYFNDFKVEALEGIIREYKRKRGEE